MLLHCRNPGKIKRSNTCIHFKKLAGKALPEAIKRGFQQAHT